MNSHQKHNEVINSSSSTSSSSSNGLPKTSNYSNSSLTNQLPTTSSNSSKMNNNNRGDHNSKNNGKKDDEESDEDEYCVYTYKGDSRLPADLPSSFFDFEFLPDSLSSSDGPSRLCSSSGGGSSFRPSNGVRAPNDSFSPDMDFLEMDFDPGGTGDEEDDKSPPHDSKDHGESVIESSSKTDNCNIDTSIFPEPSSLYSSLLPNNGPSALTDSQKPCSSASLLSTSQNSHQNRDKTKDISDAQNLQNVQKFQTTTKDESIPEEKSCSLNNNGSKSKNDDGKNVNKPEILMRLVKSSTLPCIRVNEGLILKNGWSSTPAMESYKALIKNGVEEDSVEFDVSSIMIWSVEEATSNSLSQIGTSACGATALCNVLKVLGYERIDPSFINSCIKTRLRHNSGDLPSYLFSRSRAGATHEDLLAGMQLASNNEISGRFFQPPPSISPSTLSKWLLQWICKGAVPVLTLNCQMGEYGCREMPDAWHHQMVYGIRPDSIFLTNPIENSSPSVLLPQLTSPSILKIRRRDITLRHRLNTDLRELLRSRDPRWRELNVLGQVGNVLLEEQNNGIKTSHVTIPADYRGGITLFMQRASPYFMPLLNSHEL